MNPDGKVRKLLIVDTSVLLYDKDSIIRMTGNDVYIPLVVLEELDKFKDKAGILGESARHINRFLDSLREFGNLHSGIYLDEYDVFIKVWTEIDLETKFYRINKHSNDNVILAAVKDICEKNLDKDKEIKLITKDINLRVKCEALEIKSDDYYADYEFIEKEENYHGYTDVEIENKVIDRIYQNKYIELAGNYLNNLTLNPNQFLILKGFEKEQSALCVYKNKSLKLLDPKTISESGIEPKNKEQIFALNLLMSEDIPLITLTGIPGSGKTYLTLMTALKQIENKTKNRIIFTRPIQTVGKDLGFLPGDINEKMAPWLAPIVDNFRNQFGDLSYFDMLMENEIIDVAPLSHIRGRSFNDSIIIVDEAQNATIHELKTVITRTGKNSKIVLLGDTEQVDIPYVDKFSNGLTIVVEKMKESKLTGHVSFTKGYRSELANVAAKLL